MMQIRKILKHIESLRPEIHKNLLELIGPKVFTRILEELSKVEPKAAYRLKNLLVDKDELDRLWNKYRWRVDRWGEIKPRAPKRPGKSGDLSRKDRKTIVVMLKARDPKKYREKDTRKEIKRRAAREKFQKDLAVTYQGKKKWTYGFDRRRFSVDIQSSWIDELRSHPAVMEVYVAKTRYAFFQEVPYGIEKIGVSIPHSVGLKGKGIKVCVIDTGVDYTHPDLTERYKGGYDFINNDTNPMDDHRHGTHCAGTVCATDNDFGVVGVAPEVDLYACKVLNSKGKGSSADVAAGIDWATENDMDIISMSLGGSGDELEKIACEAAWEAGLVIVAAAGNSGPGTANNHYPAAYPECISVGATDQNDQIANFSSTGSTVEVSAPGVDVKSTKLGGDYLSLSGTSMATPHVAGVAALLMQMMPTADNVKIRQEIQSRVVDLGVPGRDPEYGYGRIDASGLRMDVTYDIKTQIPWIGKEKTWNFQTGLHPLWSLKALIDVIGLVEFTFLTRVSPDWKVKTEIDACHVVDYSFKTEWPPPDFLKTNIKAKWVNPSWKFWTQLAPEMNLKTESSVKRYFEYSFSVEFDPDTERKWFPEIEIWRSSFSAPLNTIFFNWVTKGVARDVSAEIWYGKRQYLEESSVVIGAQYFGSQPKHGYDLIRNGYFQVAEQGGSFIQITDEVTFECGIMKTNSKKDVTLRLLVPEDADIAGFVFFEIVLAKNIDFLYQDKCFAEGIFGREYEESTARIIARAHILP